MKKLVETLIDYGYLQRVAAMRWPGIINHKNLNE